jgi:hypothetical protein
MMDEIVVNVPGEEPSAVDVCPRCGAAFFDFEDGEPRALASVLPDLPTGGGVATGGACPACGTTLHASSFPSSDGVPVERCGSCGGLFARREVQQPLADAPDHVVPVPSWIARLRAWLAG